MWCIAAKMRHIDTFQCFVDIIADIFRIHAEVFRTKCHIVFNNRCDNLIIWILKDHANLSPKFPDLSHIGRIHTIDTDTSRRWQQKSVKMTRQSRFSRPIRSQNGDELTCLNGKRDIL